MFDVEILLVDRIKYLRFSWHYCWDYVSSTILFVRFSGGAYAMIALNIDVQIFTFASSYERQNTFVKNFVIQYKVWYNEVVD